MTVYLQKFSDDQFITVMRERLSDEEIEELFDLLSRLLKKYLNEEEYHTLFLKDPE